MKSAPSTLVVTEHGVVPDRQTINTKALQTLIDRCSATGGGKLRFPAGYYLTGGLVLRSHITLELENGATLLGSPRLVDYHHYHPSPEAFPEGYEGVRALISAVDCENIQIAGPGTIDGQGGAFAACGSVRGGRPRNLFFARCQGVHIEGLHLRNSGFWMQHYLRCSDVRLIGLEVWNHEGSNNDGIDIDGCRDVLIKDCRIDSSDDAICLKTGCGTSTENVLVTNCFTRSHCNHIKTGTESNGDFRNIMIDGVVMTPSARCESHPGTEGADWRGACGIALGAVDGGCLENITVQNVSMDQVRVPFFIRLGDRGRPLAGTNVHQPVTYARNITIRQVSARHASNRASYIVGLPDAPVCDVTIASCRLESAGGGAPELVFREVPENRAGYPSMESFGELPASGIYARNVSGLRLRDLEFNTESADSRPALTWSNCSGVSIDGIVSNAANPSADHNPSANK